MDLMDMVWKGKKQEPQAAPTAPPAAPTAPIPTGPLPTGPLSRSAPRAVPAFTSADLLPQRSAVSADKLAQMRSRVFGSAKTPYTQILDAAHSLADIIPDETQRLKAAIKTEKITSLAFKDAVSGHQQTLLEVKSGFAQALEQKRRETADRAATLAEQAAALDRQLRDVRAEAERTTAEQRTLEASESDFAAIAAALEQEITQTRQRIEPLFPIT